MSARFYKFHKHFPKKIKLNILNSAQAKKQIFHLSPNILQFLNKKIISEFIELISL